ncbi:MAG: PEP/pyruvate-binding domain-containing protein [Rikenellaceae bacterium]
MYKNPELFDSDLLMTSRITDILLVCSSYDQFTIEEDGRIEMQIKSDYSSLSLSHPPKFTRIDNGEEALKVMEQGAKFDLVIVMFNIGEMSPFEFAKAFKQKYSSTPLVLLTSFSHEITRRLSTEDISGIDYVFSWQGNADLILAIIKMLEDKINAHNDMYEHGVQGILLVEDSVRFYSAYLPDLYKIVLSQTETSANEALNEQQRKVRKRARPKILFARTFDEAQQLYYKYGHNILGVISDISFPRHSVGGEIEGNMGFELCDEIHKRYRRMPILLQSSEKDLKSQAQEIGASFIYKNSKTLFEEMKSFIATELAFGTFKFINQKTGAILHTVSNLEELQEAIEKLPDDVLLFYSRRNIYSKWLYARGLFGLADEIREKFVEDFNGIGELRAYLSKVIRKFRRAMGQGVIAEFNPKTYNQFITFARCGEGSLGGKARGLAFVGSLIENHNLYNKWEGVRVTIPRTLALSSGYFDEFLSINGLHYLMSEIDQMEDTEILNEFIGSRLSEKLIEELRVFLSKVTRPLAVRSSSKLEDSHFQPFAGVYSTYLVPRSENVDSDLRLVTKAIKSVYASVFFSASREYIERSSNVIGEESMGVVIQEVCGTEQEGLYFPTLSGVARSLNFYPLGNEKPEEGICNIAFGLGKAVVEGASRLRFSPAHPKHTLQISTMESMLKETQRHFYALDLRLSSFKTSTDDSINFKKVTINEAKDFRNLRYVASTWDMQGGRVSDSYFGKGRPLVTFAPILKYNTFPLSEIVSELLAIGEAEMKSPVEIEFAVNMDVEKGENAIFNFLQIRPMTSSNRGESLDWENVDHSDELLYCEKALGLGEIKDVRYIVYVRTENFDAAKTPAIALEIQEINNALKERDEGYVLVGPGRWGSSDSWLGIPVQWAQISQSRIVVESGLPNFQVDPSQGTHFFQNLTSLGVGYLTMNPFNGDGTYNIEKLNAMPAEKETEYIRVIRFEEPLFIFVDGKNNKAIIKEQKD